MIPKALWLKQKKPALFASAAKICEYQDYLNLKLTGVYCASANNVAVRWHFVDGAKPTSLLEKLDLADLAGKWPPATLAPGARGGDGLTAAAAAHLGLPVGLPVAQGGADAFIAMIGLGVIRPGQLALITGSSHLHLGVARGDGDVGGPACSARTPTRCPASPASWRAARRAPVRSCAGSRRCAAARRTTVSTTR